MGDIWQSVLGVFESALGILHDLFEPLAGLHAWGFAIIALTLVIRILLLPLAIKQIRSMRAMQALGPQIKALQKKHKVDRQLLKKDPQQYRAKRQKLNEEMMALYQREKVNPMASCLPLLAQAPIFIALFWVLRDSEEIRHQPFYFFTSFISPDAPAEGLGATVSAAGWPGWLLVVLMAGTMFVIQKQMMARQAASGADNPMAQQQKILLYVMPGFLALISFQLPLGVLLYWVTTNLFQGGQQWIMLREVQHEVEEGTLAEHKGGEAAADLAGGKSGKARRPNPGASSGTVPVDPAPEATGNGQPRGADAQDKAGSNGAKRKKRPDAAPHDDTGGVSRGHIPRKKR